jgi:hypothetical protein
MSSFAWHTIHYPTLDAYRDALLPFARPGWISALTIHHTYRPTVAQWRGKRSMDGLERYYRDVQKWPAGPHLFLAVGSPNRADDGIWAGTPLADRGVHAGNCNSNHIGLEIVGDYDLAPWSPALAEQVYGLAVLLCRWGGFGPDRVHGHRECNSPKTCPGAAISMYQVRLEIRRRLMGLT